MQTSTVPTSIVDQIAVLGSELNANQYNIVCLAARYDADLEWLTQGFHGPALAIARTLDIHTSTAREWIRVGHALDDLPLIDEAFAANELSYAKTRILTRWAGPDNEHELLDLAYSRSANRLTTAIANYLAGDETDRERDLRLHDNRSVTVHTDAEGMTIIRVALPPTIGKQVAACVETIVQRVAATPTGATETGDASADAFRPPSVASLNTMGGQGASADASEDLSMAEQLQELKQRWHPAEANDCWMPPLAQQRADAFVLLFLGRNIELVTEVVIHVRGDGTTFDDGTPMSNSAVCQRLDRSFIRVMIHDSKRWPIDASNRRRYPTTRQKRVVLEAHNHECVDCQTTDLLELDHNPPYQQTRHSVTTELEPRCAGCHRVRHKQQATPNAAVPRVLPDFSN